MRIKTKTSTKVEWTLNEKDESDSWSAMSLAVFEEEWDNDKDAIYNNWRELYEIEPR